MQQGPRIYNLFPSLIGPVSAWAGHLRRIRDMGFDWVFVNPFHEPGFSGSLYAVKDYFRLNPLFRGDDTRSDDAILAGFATAAEKCGLAVMMDLVVNHTSKDSVVAADHPGWFVHDADGSLHSPGAVDPIDPEKITVWGDLAEIDYRPRDNSTELIAFWRKVATHHARLGFRGFRGDAAYKVPATVWREIVNAARGVRRDAVFVAETLGCTPKEVMALDGAGFDYLFNSAKWWDFSSPWLREQYELYRRVAPTIAFPESHDTERLATDLAQQGIADPPRIEAAYRQRYLFAAAFSTGIMMPIGYEYGFRKKLDVVMTRPSDWEAPLFDLTEFIAETNKMKASIPALNEEKAQEFAQPRENVAVLKRDDVLTIVNADPNHALTLAFDELDGVRPSGTSIEVTPRGVGAVLDTGTLLRLEPLETRLFKRGTPQRRRTRSRPSAEIASRPIVIQNVTPELDCGRFPLKREAGELFEVSAEIFKEGHDKITAVLRHRRKDEAAWREVPMTVTNRGLDRWHGAFRLEEIGRHLYTIAAWADEFESWLDEISKKRNAGQAVALELTEGRALVAAARGRSGPEIRSRVDDALREFDRAENDEERLTVLTAPRLRAAMAAAPDRWRAITYEREVELVVDRPKARFAAWYEMFPRSQGRDPSRSATFDDCIRRFDEVHAMGFDVVYFVPIHPIGRTNRKGPNNTLNPGPDDPGSPYAIGAAEGGHDAIHPDLGTLADFHRLVAAARARDMEIALDFAVQCSPDHPWLKQHPEWFEFRSDGTVKYAENPPKKYQDIVNVNFKADAADSLWRALRDVILFWIEQGVHIFRVDNPHTKPVPFWDWLIRDVQERHPDTLFLSEAFTRPPMLHMLAKLGFSQSYSYFTWRNTKDELSAYAYELAQGPGAEYLRPNFFANTPDILPAFLQTGGRPAFQIRLVLAATMASVYGIYNGFELCEAAAIPGTEEYAHSEKYEYKVWDWDRPGHIKDYIARVNRIRRDNPALQYLRNLRVYRASDPNVIFYSKMTADRSNMVFVAVNLDPHNAHSSEIGFPLPEMGIAPDAPYRAEELLTGGRFEWRGPVQHVHLDPQHHPAVIFRVSA